MPQLNPKIGEIYRHFKGNLYQVREIAKHSTTGERMVVYQALYGDFATYVRDYDEFISDVDFEKYPSVTARYRFTLVPQGELMRNPLVRDSLDGDGNGLVIRRPSERHNNGDARTLGEASNDAKHYDEPLISDLVLRFLDERDFNEKGKILSDMKDRSDLTDAVIDNLAASMDVVIDEGSTDSRFAQLRACVDMRARFENTRLR